MQQLNSNELNESNYTCIVKNNDEVVFTSTERGVKPLLDYINENHEYKDITVIDRIIGKGAMCLAIKSRAKIVITPIISKKALELADKYNVHVEYKKVVPGIINRTGTGPCPIENAVSDIEDVEEAYNIILDTLKELAKNQ
ncbi:DUF1893 domain-containing protein [Vallitalea guaymasensis]|uniref:DUF1893 domain-containing protein n=1 Tax=Vallitalea guaymasensis TaxID=1185412 RepID=A0A8J8M7K4_9FIRM|nr:DUF1893 domain-containing protein [Vallitalea guaymasensis]QUH27816.1 DUF1893 domain-containing protein [Vallitalea guaymasensis]